MFVAGSVQKTIGFALLQISVNPVEVVAVIRRIFISRGVSFMQHFVFPKLAVRRDPLVYRLSFRVAMFRQILSTSPRIRSERSRYDESSALEENTLRD